MNNLNPQQLHVLSALLDGKTQREAAQVAEVAEETVSRWRNHDSNFIAAYNEGLQRMYDESLARLQGARTKAVDRLIKLMESENEQIQYRAAQLILDLTPDRPGGKVDAHEIDEGLRKASYKTELGLMLATIARDR